MDPHGEQRVGSSARGRNQVGSGRRVRHGATLRRSARSFDRGDGLSRVRSRDRRSPSRRRIADSPDTSVVCARSGGPTWNVGLKRRRGGSMGFLAWIVVGLIAGWLAGQVMKGGGYGPVSDSILGTLGGVVGGWFFGLLGIWPGGGMLGSIIVAFVGAVILVWLTRLLKRA